MGFISPDPGTTTPWRSASVSLPSARSNRSRSATSRAIANGDDGSIRILPSQSRVMNANCGSTASLVTSRSSPYRSPISPQYATDAPPSGSTPIRSPDARDGVQVDDAPEVGHVGRPEVVPPRRARSPARTGTRRTPSSPSAPDAREDPVRLVLDPARDVRVRRAAVGRVVLEAAVVGRVVRRRHDDPVRQPARSGPGSRRGSRARSAGVGV